MSKETPAVSKNVEDYVANEEKLKNLGGGKNIADMSDDEAEAFLAERKKLKAANEAIKNEDHGQALTENEKVDAYEEAGQMNRDLDVAKVKAEEAANLKAEAVARAEQAEQDQVARQQEIDEATALAERIKNGTPGKEVPGTLEVEGGKSEERSEPTGENLGKKPIEEQIGTPKTEMFEKYGSRMREASSELVEVMKEMRANDEKKYNKNIDMAERLKAEAANTPLNDRRNQLLDDATWGSKVVKLRGQKAGETWSEHVDYERKTLNEYNRTAMQDPQIILDLAEAGQLGNGYREGEGVGRIDRKLRSDPEFMAKVLENLSQAGAESFWAHAVGEANNQELYLAAVKKNHLNYQWGAQEWKLDPEVQKVALESGLDPTYLQK